MKAKIQDYCIVALCVMLVVCIVMFSIWTASLIAVLEGEPDYAFKWWLNRM